MKYLLGVNQEKFCELNPKLNIKHLLVFTWFYDYYNQQTSMTYRTHENTEYGRVKYDAVTKDIPCLRVDAQSIRRFFYTLRDAGVLHHKNFHKVNGNQHTGSYSFYAPNHDVISKFVKGAKKIEPKSKYHKYLLSSQWNAKRKKTLARDKHKCTKCGNTTELRVHHLTYDNIFHEPLKDLVTLCEACHKQVHGIEVV